MQEREIAKAARRADDIAGRRQLEDSKVVLCEAGVALHRMGYGHKRIDDFLNTVQVVSDECAADHNLSMVQILDEETGIELKPDAEGKGWRDLAFLNAAVEVQFTTVPQYCYMRAQQAKWFKTSCYAMIFIALHRKYGWGAVRMRRLLKDIQEIDSGIHSARQAERLYESETGDKIGVRLYD